MLFRRARKQPPVYQYSCFPRTLNPEKYRRLTLQEIELLSYKKTEHDDTEPSWNVYFRPKIHEYAVSTAHSIYKPATSHLKNVSTKIVDNSKNQVHLGGEILVNVMVLQKNSLQTMAALVGSSMHQLGTTTHSMLLKIVTVLRSYYYGMVHLLRKLVLRSVTFYKNLIIKVLNVTSIFLNIESNIHRQLKKYFAIFKVYLAENYVVVLLVSFIYIVSIFTILQTILFFAKFLK